MQMKLHYAVVAKRRLCQFLEANNVSYELCHLPETTDSLCSFDLIEGQDAYKAFCMMFPILSTQVLSKQPEYSDEEIKQAEWLYIRCKSKKVKWAYRDDAFRLSCPYKRPFENTTRYKHTKQERPLTVVGKMHWSKNMFFCGPDTADDFIFCSQRTQDILGQKWAGMRYLPVFGKDKEPRSDIYQIIFNTYIPFEALGGGKQINCTSCGRSCMKIHEATSQLTVQERYLINNESVYTTGEVLVDNIIGYPTYSLNIVPHSFYKYCEDNYMNHGMIYEPVIIV